MRRVALATVIFSAVALTAAAQPVRLSGRVLSEDTGDPIVNARVSLLNAAQPVSAVLTDRDGRFLLAASPGRLIVVDASRVTVAAAKTGYARREVTANAAQPI
jgi:hypothetical protein